MCLEFLPFQFASKNSLEKAENAFTRGFQRWQSEWVTEQRIRDDFVKGQIDYSIPNYPFLEVKLSKGFIWLVFDEKTQLELLFDVLGNEPGLREKSLDNPVISGLLTECVNSLLHEVISEFEKLHCEDGVAPESSVFGTPEINRTRDYRFHLTSNGETLSKLGCYRIKTRGYCFYFTTGLISPDQSRQETKELSGLTDAVKDETVDLDVVIPGISLTCEEFRNLSPGQVLISDTKTNGMVHLTRKGKLVSQGCLNTQGPQKSIEIVRSGR